MLGNIAWQPHHNAILQVSASVLHKVRYGSQKTDAPKNNLSFA